MNLKPTNIGQSKKCLQKGNEKINRTVNGLKVWVEKNSLVSDPTPQENAIQSARLRQYRI